MKRTGLRRYENIDWNHVQKVYDKGNSLYETIAIVNVGIRTARLAVKAGVLILRNNCESQTKKKYNWNEIQTFYDENHSWRDIIKKYGPSMRAIQSAIKRGDLVTNRTFSESMKICRSKYEANSMSEEKRLELSKRQSENNRGGKSKWYDVNGIKVQGTWERDFAKWLIKNEIKWSRGKAFKYMLDSDIKHYTPDFYLPDYDLYIEIKGRWWGDDKRKIQAFKEQYPKIRLKVIEKHII